MQEKLSKAERRHALVGPAVSWAERRQFQFRFLRQFGLQPHHRLVDLGCGTLRGGIPLIEYLDVGHYTGIESRAEVLDEGRKELAESSFSNRRPRLIHAPSISEVVLDQKADYIWAFSVLIHMTDEILNDALGFFEMSFSDGGLFLGNVNIGDYLDGRWGDTGMPVAQRPWDFYQGACAAHGLVIEDLGSRFDFGDTGPNGISAEDDNRRMVRISQA